MRVAITGSTGLLGGNLATVGRELGHEVICTRRGTSRARHLDHLDLRWVEAPLEDPEALARAFDGAEIVFHSAALATQPPTVTEEILAVNVVGTRNVVTAVKQAGVRRLVHVSSTVAVGLSDSGAPVSESADWDTFARRGLCDGYTATKRQAEELVLSEVASSDLDAVVVNPGFLIGPLDARPSSGQMLIEVARGRARLASAGRNCFVDARDVARGTWLAAERGRRGERYILGGENLSYLEMFTRIARVVGVRPPIGVAPRPLGALLGLAGDLVGSTALNSTSVRWGYEPGFVFSSDKARAELGYATGPIDDAIRDAWRWMQENGQA